ncbi:MAG: acyltransferase [Chloroflexi bacterium]|nr:acyltransferase [Chloroflexota bacterium]
MLYQFLTTSRSKLLHLNKTIRLAYYRKQGLQIAEDCRLIGLPSFGSEPYLVSIGKHVTISGNVTFVTHDGATFVFRHLTSSLPGNSKVIRYGRITVHDNCFIGHGSIIMPGVTIGPNAVVGAGSIVVKDVEPNTIVGGNPARLITTVEEYAKKAVATTPPYNEENYKLNKKKELLKLFPYPW